MSAFVDGFAAVSPFNDFDALAAAVPAWNLAVTRLGSGAFNARLEVASSSALQIARFTVSAPLLATGTHPRDSSGIGLILSAPQDVRSRGRSIDPHTTAPVRLPGDEMHFVTAGPVDVVTVAVDQALFARHFHALIGVDPTTLGPDWWLRTPPGTADCAERGRAMLALQSILAGRAAVSPAARQRLQDCTLQILLDSFEADASSPRPELSAPTRRYIARRTEELLRARLDEPPSLCELCEVLGVPERTLHHAFHEAFGMRPKAYLRALRLSAAHRQLHRGEGSVTEVATGLGFFHFGRFAAEYRAMFGESPSETLRHARGTAVAARAAQASPVGGMAETG
jgi:AraC family ethanolamine operon transcriptional activator